MIRKLKEFNSGELNRKIDFYKNKDYPKTGFVKTKQSLDFIKTVWASVKPVTGNESYELERLTNSVTFDIRTRFDKELYSPDLIIFYEGERYEIKSVVDVRNEHITLAFTCKKVIKAGTLNERDIEFDA